MSKKVERDQICVNNLRKKFSKIFYSTEGAGRRGEVFTKVKSLLCTNKYKSNKIQIDLTDHLPVLSE